MLSGNTLCISPSILMGITIYFLLSRVTPTTIEYFSFNSVVGSKPYSLTIHDFNGSGGGERDDFNGCGGERDDFNGGCGGDNFLLGLDRTNAGFLPSVSPYFCLYISSIDVSWILPKRGNNDLLLIFTITRLYNNIIKIIKIIIINYLLNINY